MKSFFKTIIASTLGALIALGVMSFVGGLIAAAVMAAAFGSASKPLVIVEPNTILSLKLDNPIVDRVTNNPVDMVKNFNFGSKSTAIGLNQLLLGIKAAAGDENIKGIYLDVSNLQAGIAVIEELRAALLDFKESGKFIVSYADGYGQGAYYLASVADKIYLHPLGNVDWRGLGAQALFYKGTLQKFGIEAEIFRHGKFKGAVEPFLYDRMSAENRSQILTFAGSIWEHLMAGIEAQRGISVKKQREAAGGLLLKDARSGITQGFVDELKYKDQMISDLAQLTQQPDNEPKLLHILDYAATAKNRQAGSKNKLAVLYAEGDIVMDGESGGIAGNELAGEIRKLRRDSAVKAVVLRINSPGGSALASDIIWREVDLLRQAKPVVVSMGNQAASGGYYIACPATKIVANPTTITGSIGVFGILFNAAKGAKDKLGITADAALTEPYADFASIFRPMKPVEKVFLQHSIENIYGVFVSHVAQGRAMNVGDVDAIAQGRVWSGIDAQRLKLVDELGGLQYAINLAADLAALTDYSPVEYPKAKGSVEVILEMFGAASARIFASPAQRLMESGVWRQLKQQHGTAQARLPCDIEFNY